MICATSDKVVGIAVSQMNMPKSQAREMANDTIPKLKRWRNKGQVDD